MPTPAEIELMIQRVIIEPMRARWGMPKNRTPEQIAEIMGDYHRDLKDYDRKTLEAAFEEVRRSHRFASWPMASEFRRAAQDIKTGCAGGNGNLSPEMQARYDAWHWDMGLQSANFNEYRLMSYVLKHGPVDPNTGAWKRRSREELAAAAATWRQHMEGKRMHG